MSKRIIAIVFATALGAMVLFLTMLADPKGTGDNKPDITIDPTVRFNPTNPTGGNVPRVGEASNYYARTENDRGQVFEFFGASLEPLTEGVSLVKQPRARIHLRPGVRVLEIRADQGTFVAPDLRPRSGEVRGHVIMTLFEAPQGQTLQLGDNSPHIAMRLFLEEAAFDLEDASIDSDGPVRVTGQRFDFQGRGLRMNYNEERRRIERLIILHGRELRLAQGGQSDDAQPAAPTVAAAPADAPADAPAGDVQYYRATFEQNVVVTSGTNQIRDCDNLTVEFGAAGDTSSDELIERFEPASRTRPPAIPTATVVAGTRVIDRLIAALATMPMAQGAQWIAPGKSMMLAGEPGVIVRWTGRMAVVPIDAAPADLAAANDAVFTMTGKPLRIATADDEMIVNASQLRYFHRSGRLRLLGAQDKPVAFNSATWGVLTTTSMTLDTAEERAVFLGNGRWRSHGERDVIAEVEQRGQFAGQFDRLPAGTELSWQDRLVLNLYMKPGEGTSMRRIEAAKRATFFGDVNIYHAAFDMRSDQLTIGLDPISKDSSDDDAPATGRQEISDISASGHVNIISRDIDPNQQMNLQADRLIVGVEPNAGGGLQPTGFLAQGNVKARQRDVVMRCGELLVEVTDDPNGGIQLSVDPNDAGKASDIRAVTATNNVVLDIRGQNAEVTADRMYVEGSQIEFFGSTIIPARMINDDGILAADHFLIDQPNQTLHAIGPGTLDIFARPESGEEDGQRRTLLNVQWDKNMNFDNLHDYAHFVGNVRSRAKRAATTTRLDADDLRLDFLRAQPDGAAAQSGELDNLLTAGDRALRSITATRNVQFVAADWGSIDASKPLTRITIEGGQMSFETMTEQVQVIGEGRMGMEDYRPTGANQAGDSSDPLVNVSGRGVTLFTFAGGMDLDFKVNDMRLRDQVQMLHVPLGSTPAEGLQLDCRRFVADFIETGGLGALSQKQRVETQLRSIGADEDVRVIHKQHEIYTDILDYTHFDQVMVLRAKPGREAQIIDTARGTTPLRARAFLWDLSQNRFEIVDPGRATMYIPEQRR